MASRILIFGDDQADNVSAFRKLYRESKTRPQLGNFLQAATDIVQLHLSALAVHHEKLDFGQFNDLLQLAECMQVADNPEATACAVLITAAQVGELICLTEDDTSILSRDRNSHALGFCIGLLAASVAAGSRESSEVVRLGAEVVGVSFRLGLDLRRRARLIEDSPRGWSVVVAGPKDDIAQGLKTFNQYLPSQRQAYAGVVVSAWTTVFGPPSTLTALVSSTVLEQFPKALHTGTTAIHAPHFASVGIDSIVGKSPLFELTPPYRIIFSCRTCQPIQATNVKHLLEHAVVDIASSPLWPEEGVKALAATLKAQEAVLTPVGPTCYTQMVQTLLQNEHITTRLSSSAQRGLRDVASRGNSGLIAIVGMSGRFPGCNDSLEEFWDLLVSGTSTHEEVPASRFSLRQSFDPTQSVKNAVLNRFGCFLKNPGMFDPGFFKVSPREAVQMDPLHRMFLMATYEALEQTGYQGASSNSLHQARISTFFSQTTDDWRMINEQQGIDTHYAPCSNRAFASGRVAHHFGWSGGAYSVDTACSSSATSVHLACNSLANRESDTAVVGGGSLCVVPEPFSGLGKGGFLSLSTDNGSCKTFQEAADGYCRGEAVGVVVLKRLEDAVAENDNVLAVICGSARNSNAGEASITLPSEMAQEALFLEILRKSHIDPSEVGFIEMHGTGTQAGDKVEMNSVRKVFAKNRTADNPLYVGAVKALVGHSEAAAGVVSLIKAVLMLRHGSTIPPQPGYPFTLNRSFGSLATAHIRIADGRSSFQAPPKGDGTRRVLINSFDAAGGNVGLLIQEAPEPKPRVALPRRCHLVTISGRTATALQANKARLRKFLVENPSVAMGDLAYTTTARRLHHVQREAFVASSVAELCELLAERPSDTRPSTDPGSLIFVFTGEGSLYTGMGATLYKTSHYLRRVLNSLQAASDAQGQQTRFIDLITGDTDVAQASTPMRHMALVALEIALAQFWQSLGLIPSLVMGHSLGEYAALCTAGVLSMADTLYLVYERAVLIEQNCKLDLYAMLAIYQPANQVQQLLDETELSSCEISCVNGPSSTVVSGPRADLRRLECLLRNKDIKTAALPVRFGFHSAQMDTVRDAFERIASGVVFAKPRMPIASTALAKIVTDKGVFGSSYLGDQMRRPVNVLSTIQTCEAAGFMKNGSNLIDIGPNPICASLIAQSLQNVTINFWASLQKGQEDWKSINTVLAKAYVANLPVVWKEFYRHDLHMVRLIDLPKYAFDLKNYWHSYQKQSTAEIVEEPCYPPRTDAHGLEELPYTGLQFLEAIDMRKRTATFLSKTADSILSRAIQGHLVEGLAVCPASVFADMAVTAAICLLRKTGTAVRAANLEIVDMDLINPLVVQHGSDPSQRVRVHAWELKEGQDVAIQFSSEDQGERNEHCTCTIRVYSSSATLTGGWEKIQKLVKDQVKALKQGGKSGIAYHMNTAVVYKLFDNVVEYSKDYTAIKEAFVAMDFKEAAAIVDLSETFGSGNFTWNPFAIDPLVHLAGFLLNANFHKPASDVYIANHIGIFHVAEDLMAITGHTFTCFATISKQTSITQTWCNVYVYDDQRLIARCNVRFQKMKRDVLRLILGKTRRELDPAAGPPVSKGSSHTTIGDIEREDSDEDIDSLDFTNENTSASDTHPFDVSEILLGVIARHTGINASDIELSCRIADVGIDSLMALAILADFEKKSSLRLPAAFFTRIETVADALEELHSFESHVKPVRTCSTSGANSIQGASARHAADANRHLRDNASHTRKYISTSLKWPDIPPARADSPQTVPLETITVEPKTADNGSRAPEDSSAKSKLDLNSVVSRTVLIQGRPENNERPLFLVTDGSGTVSGYIHLPALPDGRKIYALESPFVERPQDYTLSIREMAQVFMRAIRREQPKGPYLIGGWSAGGIYAYEICHQFAQQGEVINSLVIIDMAITRPVLSACEITTSLLEETGVFTGVDRATNSLTGLADMQKMHIASTVRAVAQYRPLPFPKGKEPLQTHLVWAAQGLADSLKTEEHDNGICNPASMKSEMTLSEYVTWLKDLLHGKRMRFGTNGWEILVGDKIQVTTIEGDHFSIVRPPHVAQLGAIILHAVALNAEMDVRMV
ncbi:Putative thioesterase, Acyl transferase domain superfamily, phosphopantetheine binding ACP [Septoria linicola]|uniref:Thioesterase, Acyl transferase domain superfamily, phosphopantetheine binding ACP n=1 Tax=Septoria linicola TaxID=215465 RepID=A0A9Q9B9C7_9PEZI|nr:Putative thioesterase, Acyl transferase domain superfamily, phosphopantetheine binding ACP [Septoria linicola]